MNNITLIKAYHAGQQDVWKINTLDAVLLELVNGGSWLFSSRLEADKLKASLAQVLDDYPIFAGRLQAKDCIVCNNAGAAFTEVVQAGLSCKDLQKLAFAPSHLMADFPLKEFKKGLFPVLSVKLVQLADCSLLSVAINHVCADGYTLYRFMNDWAAVCRGEKIEKPVLDQHLFPQLQHKKEELPKILTEKKWYPLGMKDLFSLIVSKFSNKSCGEPLFVADSQIEELRAKYPSEEHIGSNAWLSALIIKMISKQIDLPAARDYSLVTVVNLRDRIVFPKSFIGNAVLNVASEKFDIQESINELAGQIQRDLRKSLQSKEAFEDFFNLYIETMSHQLPFMPFDVSRSIGKKPHCFIVNNFCSFPIYTVNFGEGIPTKAFPNDLPDTIKIWPSAPQEAKGYFLLFRGNIAGILKGATISL